MKKKDNHLKSTKQKMYRINVAVYAYAYEIMNNPIASDSHFDNTCKKIDLKIPADNAELDKWFMKNFDPCTGQWIHKYPKKYLPGIIKIYRHLEPYCRGVIA